MIKLKNDKELKIGSLFDGIGIFPLAASCYGMKHVWASEVEKAPISITKHYFTNMLHLGDITKVNGGEIPLGWFSSDMLFLWFKSRKGERYMMSLKEQEIYEEKVMEWIGDHFVLNEVEIEDYPFFSSWKIISR